MSAGLRRRAVATLVLSLASAPGCGSSGDPARSADAADAAARAGAPPDLVLFVLDAARADHLGCYGYDHDTTPRIDAFARGATRYADATSEASFTFASVAALFTGRPPRVSGLLSPWPVAEGVDLLAERARAAGYRSHAYSQNPFVSERFGLHAGFSHFRFELPVLDAAERGPHPGPGHDGVREAVAFAARSDDAPFLLYVHLLRPHNPYAPDPGFAGRFGSGARDDGNSSVLLALDREGVPGPARLANIVALYDENLATADALFGALLDGLRAADRLDDAVVVVLSDHGEAFGEHGRLLHSTTVFQEMVRVPLIVRVPGVAPGVVDTPVQLADLGRALRSVMAGEAAPDVLARLGREPDAPVVSWSMRRSGRVAVRAGSRKVLVDADALLPLAEYDLARDPGEQRPLPAGAEGARWTAWLAERLGEGPLGATREPAERSRADPELPLRRQLEALGYVDP